MPEFNMAKVKKKKKVWRNFWESQKEKSKKLKEIFKDIPGLSKKKG